MLYVIMEHDLWEKEVYCVGIFDDEAMARQIAIELNKEYLGEVLYRVEQVRKFSDFGNARRYFGLEKEN